MAVADITLERTMPQAVDLERIILGSIMARGVCDVELQAEMFYLEAHRAILSAIQDLAYQGKAPDVITVKHKLAAQDNLDRAGGPAYLVGLTEGVPMLPLEKQYVDVLREKHALRTLISASSNALTDGYSGASPSSAIIERLLTVCDEISRNSGDSGLMPIDPLVSEVYREIESLSNRQTPPDAVATGFTELDRMMCGGARRQDHTVIAGRPGTGKSAMLFNLAINMAQAGESVAIFELEMSYTQMITRMLAVIGEVDHSKLRTGFLNRDDWARLARAAGTLSQLKIWISDLTGLTVTDIKSQRRRVRHDIPNVMVDYLQLVSPPPSHKNRTEQEQVAAVSKALKFMAKSENIRLITAAQLSRAGHQRRDNRPQLTDLRSTGQIEQDADTIIFLHRPDLTNPTEDNSGIVEVIVGKQRSGPVGEFRLAYIPQYTKFGNLWQSEDI